MYGQVFSEGNIMANVNRKATFAAVYRPTKQQAAIDTA